MQLTKLEIKGFKSFADRVVIHFDEGITGVVGPNGCGKSNVVDSIRWVLGEQKTRVLRSDKMENVIFNGTKARKPTQLAEVSLTFNNTKNLIPTEYSQVTITRKYYRSGESEYQLNGVTCRLKDITNLFLDTGIASNSYSIIELKMVDDILNDKDNSRRTLFEEAAGISKFKIRKKETLRKLNDTDADLERVEDLLFEIEKNLKSLERQASQAKKYYELKGEYRKTSIALAKKTLKDQQETFDSIQAKIQQENDKRLSLNSVINEKEAFIEQTKSKLIQKEKLLSSRQKTLNEHVSTIRQYESDKKIKNERQKFLHDKIDRLKEQIGQDKLSSERAASSLEGLRNEARSVEKDVTEVLSQVEKLKADYEQQKTLTSESQRQLTSLSEQYAEKKELQFQLTKAIEIKSIQLKSMLAELSKTSEDSTEKSANLEEFESRLTEIAKNRAELQSQFDQVKSAEENLKDRIAETEEQLIASQENMARTNRSLDAKQNEFNLTKSLVDNLEGFPEAIKFLKKNPKWRDAPLLSDVLSCPEDYRIAIENFLEPYMNYYIVDTQEEALAAVHLLTEASRGKANFFILNHLEKEYGEISAPANSIPALDIVDFDAKYTALIHMLLQQVFISEQPLGVYTDGITLLDKEGKVTLRPYSVSGGSIGLFEGKRIGRGKNLENLEKEIKTLKETQSIEEKNVNRLKTLLEEHKQSSKQQLLEEVQENLARVKEMEVSIQTKQEQFIELLTSNKNRREDIQQQISELEIALADLQPKAEKEKNEQEELSVRLESKRAEAISLQEELDKKSALYNEENVRFHQIQNRLNSILQEITFKEESYENALNRIESGNVELDEATNSLNELVKKSTASDDDLISMYEEKEALEVGVNEAEREYYDTRTGIDEEEKGLREAHRTREGIDHALMEWQNSLNDAKMGLNSVKDRLSVEFNLAWDQISEEEISDYKKFSQEELRAKVDKLRNRIDTMGPVNPMAMEAFEEIKERHTFITTQKEDLLKAKESLLTTIGEIDEVAKDTFMTAFTEIKTNFIRVFRTLFTDEDDCDLMLTQPDQPLESSIEIIAKPKGKRPLTINQLSGGEKTLTATSLLFSIYLLKPAPFCIFDEVDAPLDDANIDKFNEIIRKFSKESQFIIVTHNKRTMASTDVIYGVTMQEQGVSKVVPVDLRELA